MIEDTEKKSSTSELGSTKNQNLNPGEAGYKVTNFRESIDSELDPESPGKEPVERVNGLINLKGRK